MEKFFQVKNRSSSTVGYAIPEIGIRKSFMPGEVKKISAEELEKLTYQPGGKTLLTAFLQILSEEGIQAAELHVEPEYHMNEKDVIELLKNGSLDAFLDTLDFAPQGVLDLIKKYSVELPLLDLNKRKAIEEKLGFNVEAALKHDIEDKEGAVQKEAAKRRVQTEETAVPAGRRTTPKYNVVSTDTE